MPGLTQFPSGFINATYCLVTWPTEKTGNCHSHNVMETFSALSDSPSNLPPPGEEFVLVQLRRRQRSIAVTRDHTSQDEEEVVLPCLLSPFEENLFRALRTFFCQLDHLSLSDLHALSLTHSSTIANEELI